MPAVVASLLRAGRKAFIARPKASRVLGERSLLTLLGGARDRGAGLHVCRATDGAVFRVVRVCGDASFAPASVRVSAVQLGRTSADELLLASVLADEWSVCKAV